MTLEQRVARLERALSRKNEDKYAGYRLLEKFADELYAEIDLKADKGDGSQFMTITKSSSGRVEGVLPIDNKPDSSTWNKFVAMCNRFKRENNCRISARVLQSDYYDGYFIGVIIKFDDKVDTSKQSKPHRSDDDGGYDYSDPEYRDMVKSADWAEDIRDMGNY